MRFDTALLRFDAAPGDPARPTSTPICQTATFAQPDALGSGPYDFTRSGNPTRAVLEAQLARLEGVHRAFAFTSGMAALTAVTRLLRPGDEVLVGDDLYGGTWRLLHRLVAPFGVQVTTVDAGDVDAVSAAASSRTKLVLVETPTNPLLRIVDIGALADVAHRVGARLAVDGTLTSFALQRPLSLGADLVIHSATKLLCGHGDVMAGVVAAGDPETAEAIAFVQNAEGAGLAPFDAWLLLRGLKTLSLRVKRQQATAGRIARLLVDHPDVARVWWPGLPDHPGAALHARQARGPGQVISFETGDVARSRRVVEALSLFTIAVSFGSVTSSVSLPCAMSHASIPSADRALPEDLVRLSIGAEDADDLLDDLSAALAG